MDSKIFQLFTINEIAAQLRVTPRSVRNYIRNGKLQVIRFEGNVRISDLSLSNFLSRTETEAADYASNA